MSRVLTIIPFYNTEPFLEGAIESILQQTYQNTQLILVDDASTDKSLEIAKSYEHLGNVIVLHNTKNRGTYYSINKALHKATSLEWDYWNIHGSDDLSDLNRIQHHVDIFKNNPNIKGLKSTCIEYDFKTNQPTIKNGNYSTYTGEGIAFYKRCIFDKLGYYDNTRFSGDTDYMWRLEAVCATKSTEWEVGVSKEILYINYSHDKNITKLYDWEVTRPQYWQKVREEIQNKMIPNNNFYREIFE